MITSKTLLVSPNQKVITIHREPNPKEDYLKISFESLMKAMGALKGNTFKLYIELCCNANGFVLRFYSKDFKEETGMCAETVSNCFKELIEKGFLVERGNLQYDFYEGGVGNGC